MSLLLQLDLRDLPSECGLPLRDGLLGVFACLATEGCDVGAPFGPTSSILVYPRAPVRGDHVSPNAITRVPITGWSPFEDLPDPAEHEFLGLRYEFLGGGHVRVECADPAFSAVVDDPTALLMESVASAAEGDKLGGWARAIQAPVLLPCPECASDMRMLVQIDSLKNLQHMFGDGGIAHVLYCPEHLGTMAYVWSCS